MKFQLFDQVTAASLKQRILRQAGVMVALITIVSWCVPGARAQTLERVLNEQVAANKEAAASQARIDQLNDQAQGMLGKYRQTVTDAESLKKYNEQLAIQVKSQ